MNKERVSTKKKKIIKSTKHLLNKSYKLPIGI
jgi:hypothetical protein